MGGYVTQSRSLNRIIGDKFPLHHEFEGSDHETGHLLTRNSIGCIFLLNQTTTSYRSGGDVEEPSDFGRTLGAAAQQLRTERFNQESLFDNGHPFDTMKREVLRPGNIVDVYQPRDFGTFPKGHAMWGYLPVPYPLDWKAVAQDPDKNYWGTRAIDSTKPGDSPAAVAQALLELYREGLPRLFGATSLQSRTLRARDAGSEYLNKEFGWDPLIRDVRDLAGAVARSRQILHDFVNSSGVKIRRSLDFPLEATAAQTLVVPNVQLRGPVPPFVDSDIRACFSDWVGTVTRTVETTRKRWFRGAYTYYVPPSFLDATFSAFVERSNYLYGLELTPELLWELAPWSWLADWLGNIGSIISNAVALSSDGLVMRYGYLMSETQTSVTDVMTGIVPKGGTTNGPLVTSYRTIRKERIRATPYGFGLNPSSFNARQWAILAALGLTRGNANSLRLSD